MQRFDSLKAETVQVDVDAQQESSTSSEVEDWGMFSHCTSWKSIQNLDHGSAMFEHLYVKSIYDEN